MGEEGVGGWLPHTFHKNCVGFSEKTPTRKMHYMSFLPNIGNCNHYGFVSESFCVP